MADGRMHDVAQALLEFVVVVGDDGLGTVMTCDQCNGVLFSIDNGDSLVAYVETALLHKKVCPRRSDG